VRGSSAPIPVADSGGPGKDRTPTVPSTRKGFDFHADAGPRVNLFDRMSALGATITRTADGALRFDPSTSDVLRDLPGNGTVTDSFDVTVTGEDGVASTVNVRIVVTAQDYGANPNDGTTNNDPGSGLATTLTTAGQRGYSERGAAVALNADGSVRYDPTTSHELDQLIEGKVILDWFSFRVADRLGRIARAKLQRSGRNRTPTTPGNPITIDIGDRFMDFDLGRGTAVGVAPWQVDFATQIEMPPMAAANEALRLSLPRQP